MTLYCSTTDFDTSSRGVPTDHRTVDTVAITKGRMRNAARFLLRIYVPSDKDFWVARQALKADLAWQPYLYTAVFWGVVLTVIFGDGDTIPPIDRIDQAWILFGLISPVVGFAASMMLRLGQGQIRYSAFWLRIGANVGMISAISTYLLAVVTQPRPMTVTTYMAAVIFLTVLIVKDSHFLIQTEQVAKQIRDKHGDL